MRCVAPNVVCVENELQPSLYSGVMMVWRWYFWKPPGTTVAWWHATVGEEWGREEAMGVRPHLGFEFEYHVIRPWYVFIIIEELLILAFLKVKSSDVKSLLEQSHSKFYLYHIRTRNNLEKEHAFANP